MSLKDVLKSPGVPAIAAGIGLVALAPLLLRGVGGGGRPLAKALLHNYLDLAESCKGLSAEAREHFRDLLAEVHAERQAREAADVVAASDLTAEL